MRRNISTLPKSVPSCWNDRGAPSSHNADQFAVQVWGGLDSLVDPLSQRSGIAILGAGNDSCMMSFSLLVQPKKIQAVQRENRPAFFSREAEHFGIGDFLVGTIGLQRSQHIMPERPKALNRAKRKILVRVKPGHQAMRLA